ncbi:MAG: hypothetical protein DHS20C02_19230 [Micavibrio sp.]|nr:MAG: hypothetical protein DHS20C02_19230 [Micavibrio sp.]
MSLSEEMSWTNFLLAGILANTLVISIDGSLQRAEIKDILSDNKNNQPISTSCKPTQEFKKVMSQASENDGQMVIADKNGDCVAVVPVEPR